MLQQIANSCVTPFCRNFVFVEDYDINVGRHASAGCGRVLNNPRRPLEASGTSGQKVVLNGGLNLSVLDGWWAEAYDGQNGFASEWGAPLNMTVHDAQDAEALQRTLRDDSDPALLPARQRRSAPRWIKRMKRTIRTLAGVSTPTAW